MLDSPFKFPPGVEATEQVKHILGWAQQYANIYGQDYIGVNHLLFSLMYEPSPYAVTVIKKLVTDMDEFYTAVSELMVEGPDIYRADTVLPFTERSQQALVKAVKWATDLNNGTVDSIHLLLGLLFDHESVACKVLNSHGVTLTGVVTAVRPNAKPNPNLNDIALQLAAVANQLKTISESLQ